MVRPAGGAGDPLWYKDAIIYETHVKAFFDSDDDGIGDFAGFIKKLDYLQDLGVTCLWLLPFFPSPLRDDGYDISDYRNVHPSYGTLDDFRRFMQAARDRGLQVIIELVVNHTSDQHPWFLAARKAPPGSPERDYYVWSETDKKYQDVRIIFLDTEKSNWTWDAEAKAYYWHRFFSHQPDLNFDNPRVLEEVIQAMSFWFDLGVDGLRLDAIPYLVERDGTNGENLPETHEAIRKIRRHVDENYANRMLLAEANQWPSDVRAYFGNADECHMAFHFPLMPRIFMALRLEDRHPITEILAQTPEIPPSCQWGIFLRNHDELTLEMVTDEERDYMYYAYSADPRMRLNLGIRRRLAPLMENNRRRIELLNSILFSFPGTPILYYGDEIGMGDNIYLGDRNGVRTPMQWSADRNAGFSRANPAKLYSPVLLDPVYGYEAINVEAQQGDSSSLLHWTRNMIALRKIYKVFGRGSIEFFRPKNRKILAYLRKYQDEQVLCVANLSRFAQPVELELDSLAGLVPVEMLGYTEFPQIGRAPYALTLGPYGFYWFELQPAPAPVEVQVERDEEEMVSVGQNVWEWLLDGSGRQRLEQKRLPQYLPAQRWFRARSGTIRSCRIADWVQIAETPEAALAMVETSYESGDPETYVLLLAAWLDDGGAPPDAVTRTAVCGLRRGRQRGIIYDGTHDETACAALLEWIESGRTVTSSRGVIRCLATSAFAELRGCGALPSKHASAEQSNTSILYGERLILKLFRRLESGRNPDLEIGRFLTERSRFDRVPRLAGALEYQRGDEPPATLAMLQELAANQGDGWAWTLEALGRYYEERVSAQQAVPESELEPLSLLERAGREWSPLARETIGFYLDSAATLGRRTAEMHLALAGDDADPSFTLEPITAKELADLLEQLRVHAADTLDLLKSSVARLPDELIEHAGLLLNQRRRILDRFRDLPEAELERGKSRIHGDYHLGQVLVSGADYSIIDFEGEHARTLEERRAKHSPLKDVAGMLRSFSYAAYVALFSYVARRPDEVGRLEAWADLWVNWVSAAFLRAYLETARDAPFLPRPGGLEPLLDAYLLDKALCELRHEIDNRPDWVRIPLHGILPLIQRS